MKKNLVIVGVVILVIGMVLYLYLNKPHRSVASEDAIEIEADFLFQAFQGDEASANEKYLNKVLRVHGKIVSVEKNADGSPVIVLEAGDSMFGINCTLQKEYAVKVGDEVRVRGVCTGFLSDVVLTQGLIDQ